MRPPVLLFDVYSLFYRAYFALPQMNTRAGEPTSAVYGFAAILLKVLRELAPAGGAFAVDAPVPTFRHAAYPEYKGTRGAAAELGGVPDTQYTRLAQLIDAFGFPAFVAEEFEADDILATLARELREAGEAPIIVTGDLDLLQCARDGTRVLIVSRAPAKAELYDAAAVERRFGVPPRLMPDFRALTGDPSDNLPGVPHVGPKAAAALLARFGDLPAVLRRLAEVEPPRLQLTLSTHADRLPLWLHLSRLREDVPLPEGAPRWAPLTDAAAARVRALFEELEFRSLVPRLAALPVAAGAPFV